MMRAAVILLLLSGCAETSSFVELDDGGIAQICGRGFASCSDGELCDYPDDLCGDGEPGVCVVDIQACADVSMQVCVCGGSLEPNACYANRDVDARGGCERREGTWSCGFRVCNDHEYCIEQSSERGLYYDCQPFACTEPSCACVPEDVCDGTCVDEDGRAVLRCD